jgi:rfaE bifunctional protein nucleotidyltransferase chain/domain
VPGARAVLPNVAEAARALSTTPARTVHEASRQARELVRAWQVRSVALTRAAAGAVLAGGGGVVVVPAPVTADADACGAGDRFAAAVTAALAQGALPSEAVAAAVGAASRFVTGGGVHAYTDTDTDTGDAPRSTERHADPRALAADVRGGGGTVVATGGCFDILHPGHIATLNAARAMGDCLVVCINSDDSVRARKGPERPVQSLADRTEVLLGLAAVDGVLAFDEATPERVLAQLRPDVWVKGGDYAADELPETPLVRSWGGEVVTVPYLPERSTSRLLRKARS